MVNEFPAVSNSCLADSLDQALQEDLHGFFDTLSLATLAVRYHLMTYLPVSYTHLRAPRDATLSRMPSSA